MKSLLFPSAIAALVGSLLLGSGAGAVDLPGKSIYMKNCVACHGPTGRGDGVAAASLPTRPRNLAAGVFKYGSSDADLVRTVTDGIRGTAMAGFRSRLSDAEIRLVVAYVRTLHE